MNDVLKVIEERSSIRRYKEEFPSMEQVYEILKAGLLAPTAMNRQEIHISVVKRGNEALKVLEEEVSLALGNNSPFDYNVPYVFFLSADPEFHYSAVDAGICVENMALAAQSLGLSSVILGRPRLAIAGEKKDYYAKSFEFPEGYIFEIAIGIGYKDIEKTPHSIDFEKNISYID